MRSSAPCRSMPPASPTSTAVRSCDTRSAESGEIDAGNARFAGQEAMIVFEDVFVPKEHVFMDGEVRIRGDPGRALHLLSPSQLRMQDRRRRRADRRRGDHRRLQRRASAPRTSATSSSR